MKPRSHSLAVRLDMVRHAVSIKDYPPVRDHLEKYGFNNSRFKEGEDLYNEAIHYDFLQQNCRAEQFNATDRLLKIFEDARRVYIDYVKIARVALKGDRTALQKLELTGLRKKEFSLWLSEAKAFYNGALETPEIQTKLNRFGLTRKVLKEGLNLVKEAENQREIRNRLKADAIDATRKRNAALKKAESWRSDLVTVARVAIKGSAAQRLEVLDLTITGEYSERTQAQADAEMLVEIPGEPEPQEPEEVIKE